MIGTASRKEKRAASSRARPRARPDYAASLAPGGLTGVRIGVPRKGLFGQSAPADRLAEAKPPSSIWLKKAAIE